MKTSHRLFLLLFVLLQLSCGGPAEEQLPPVAAGPQPGLSQQEPPATARPIHDRARFLVGLEAHPSSPYAGLQDGLGSRYEAHAARYWNKWRPFNYHRFQPMKRWSADYLGNVGGTVFYPFGGPDALNALAMFPGASRFILVGLEPVGGFTADPLQTDPATNLIALERLYRGTETLLDASYFVTKDMKVDFEQPPFTGTSPVMQGVAALAGYQVLAASEGRTAGLPSATMRVLSPRGLVQEVVYIQGDLSDGGPSAMLSWVRSQNPHAVYLKAASYLLHEPGFGRIRSFILDVPGPIVQDDSGVPFAVLRGNGRRVQLFGEYRGVLDIFEKYRQNDLAAAYAQVNPPELPFNSGYAVRFGASNLQVAWPSGGGPVGAQAVPVAAPVAPVTAPATAAPASISQPPVAY